MSVAADIANEVGNVAAPIVSNAVQRVLDEIETAKEDVLERLSGKVIKIEITLPNLKKDA